MSSASANLTPADPPDERMVLVNCTQADTEIEASLIQGKSASRSESVLALYARLAKQRVLHR
jgi:hypothetical protein